MDQEEVARLIARHDLMALPVVDAEGRMKGIVTVDDIVDVVQEEATEDIQKIGGMEALDAPYLETGFRRMVRKRGGWLAALFLGEMLTATAMARFEEEIARAVVLALFVPLIISSGGNSGSQASTLVIRAMALGEVRLRDWWRVAGASWQRPRRSARLLASIGSSASSSGRALFHSYGEHSALSRSRSASASSASSPGARSSGLDAAVHPAPAAASTPRAPRRRSWRRSSTCPASSSTSASPSVILRGTLL